MKKIYLSSQHPPPLTRRFSFQPTNSCFGPLILILAHQFLFWPTDSPFGPSIPVLAHRFPFWPTNSQFGPLISFWPTNSRFGPTDSCFGPLTLVLVHRLSLCSTDSCFGPLTILISAHQFSFWPPIVVLTTPPCGKSFFFKPFLRVCAQIGIELESDLNTLMLAFKDL